MKLYVTYHSDREERVRAVSPLHAAEKISSRHQLEEGVTIEVDGQKGHRQGYRVGNQSRNIHTTGRVV